MSESSFNPVHKDDFEQVYDLTDPRPYYRGLLPTNYRMPEVVANLVCAIEGGIRVARGSGGPLHVLDFACGYGAIGALARHHLSMTDLYRYYADDLPARTLAAEFDPAYFLGHRNDGPELRLSGIDIAGEAVKYSQALGFIDDGFAENLAASAPSEALAGVLSSVDLVVESGSLAVALPNVFRQIVELGNSPWILYCPRPDNDWSALESVWQELGYEAQACGPASVAYRKPLGDFERDDVLAKSTKHGRPRDQVIGNGYIRVVMMLARPARHVSALPAVRLFAEHGDLFSDPE